MVCMSNFQVLFCAFRKPRVSSECQAVNPRPTKSVTKAGTKASFPYDWFDSRKKKRRLLKWIQAYPNVFFSHSPICWRGHVPSIERGHAVRPDIELLKTEIKKSLCFMNRTFMHVIFSLFSRFRWRNDTCSDYEATLSDVRYVVWRHPTDRSFLAHALSRGGNCLAFIIITLRN
jgi:hypothetical protein